MLEPDEQTLEETEEELELGLNGPPLQPDPYLQNQQQFAPSIDTEPLLNNKIVSSHNMGEGIVIKKPKFEQKKYWIPLLDKQNQIIYKNGKPILHKIKTGSMLTGFEEQLIKFPIKDWFNDSVTSSILDKEDVMIIREIDDLGFSFWAQSINNPKINIQEFITWLYWLKASRADAAKGLGGAAVNYSKMTISKGDNPVSEYRKEPAYQKWKDKQQGSILKHNGKWFGLF